tara:strand:+ start:604 stop:918 length:315 start_codon:yes stop_codon:yes gene_type:complete
MWKLLFGSTNEKNNQDGRTMSRELRNMNILQRESKVKDQINNQQLQNAEQLPTILEENEGGGKRRKTKRRKTKGRKTKGKKTKRRKTKRRKTKGRKTKGRKTSR